MHFQRAVDRLYHDRLAALVLQKEMRAGDRALRVAETWHRRRHKHDILDRFSYLIDGGEIGERPGAEFLRRQCAARVLWGRIGVLGAVREIEKANGKALIVHPIEDGGKAERIGADEGKTRRVDEALAAVGQRAAHFLAGGDDQHLRLHRETELERAAADGSAVARFEADAGAGEAWRGGEDECRAKCRDRDFADHGGLLRDGGAECHGKP